VTLGKPLVPTSIRKIGSQMGSGLVGATDVFDKPLWCGFIKGKN
jgi:hypothetical protein